MQNGYDFLKKGREMPKNILPLVINPPGGQSSGGGGGTWGSITGTITDQADLVAYILSQVAGLFDLRANYDASSNAYPSTGGSGTAGAIKKGDAFPISVAGTLPTSRTVEAGDLIYALVDSATNSAADWGVLQFNIGYTPQPQDQDLTDISGLTPSNDDFMQRKAGAWVNRTIAQVKADLGINGSIADVAYTQPSASTSWVLVHGRSVSPNFAFFNNLNEREYPLEDHSVAGQVTLTFATAVVHKATLPGNGTSASIRNDSVITVLASAVNAASGVIDITTAKTVIILMDANLTSDITFVGTPTAGTPLRLIFVNGATAYTASLAAAKFKSSDTLAIPVPLLPVTPNREHSFDFIAGSLSGKFGLTGYVYGL